MFDSSKILGQIESDGSFGGGDSTSWHGAYTILGGDSRSFRQLFEVGFGAYARHPSEGYASYYKNPWDGRITRDQLSGILAALIHQKDCIGVWRVAIHALAWLWLFDYATRSNGSLSKWKWPDLTGPCIWALYLRGMLGPISWLIYPLLVVLDLHDLINALIVRRSGTEHVISLVNRMLACRERTPTFITYLTFKILPKELLLKRLTNYWCGWRGNCFIIDMYREKL